MWTFTNLDVGRVLVGLVGRRLQLLTDPGLDLIHVPAELLQGLRFAQLGTLLDHLGLEATPPVTGRGWGVSEGVWLLLALLSISNQRPVMLFTPHDLMHIPS